MCAIDFQWQKSAYVHGIIICNRIVYKQLNYSIAKLLCCQDTCVWDINYSNVAHQSVYQKS